MRKTDWAHEFEIGIDGFQKVNMEVSSLAMRDQEGKEFEVTGMAVTEGVDKETGDIIYKGFLVDNQGNAYGTISETAIHSMTMAEDIVTRTLENGGRVYVYIDVRKSKGNRDFIALRFRGGHDE